METKLPNYKESYTGQNRLYNAGDQGESWDQRKNGTRVHQLPEMLSLHFQVRVLKLKSQIKAYSVYRFKN
jgi:hypothetical protein